MFDRKMYLFWSFLFLGVIHYNIGFMHDLVAKTFFTITLSIAFMINSIIVYRIAINGGFLKENILL